MICYGLEDQERLDLEPEECVYSLMDGLLEDEKLEYPIRVYEYKPVEIWAKNNIERYARDILEDLLIALDDDVGDPDRELTEPTEKMKQAALLLAKAIVEDYKPWVCEKTGKVIEFSEDEAKDILG